MRVPSLKPGKHTLTLKVDTNSIFGVLTADRAVTIEDGAVEKIAAEYLKAQKEGNLSRMSTVRKKLLAVRFSHKINPGQEISIEKPLRPNTVVADFSAKIKWFPEHQGLRAVVNVIDPAYGKPRDDKSNEPTDMVYLLVAPSGVEKDISAFIVQRGQTDESPIVQFFRPAERSAGVTPCAIKATWKTTSDGYNVDINIPWNRIQGYREGWTVMPVEAVVVTAANGWSAFAMTKEGDPFSSVNSYSVLTSK